MGGHYLEPVFYGTGFFKDGKFTSLKEQVIEADNDNSNLDYKKYSADLAKLDQWLNAPCESSDLTNGFASCNLKEHAVNRLMTGAELKQTYGIDITKAVGYFLLPGILQANENNSIYVAYAVNGFIVAEFDEFTGCSEGVSQHNIFIAQRAVDEFNHFDEHDYGYECVNLTGIVMNK